MLTLLRNGFIQRFADLRWAGFLPQMFMRSTKLSATPKLSAENETPPIANVLLCVRLLFCRVKFNQFFKVRFYSFLFAK